MNFLATVLLFLSWPFSTNQAAIKEINAIKVDMKGYYSTNPDSAAILAKEIILKSKKIGYELGQAKGEFALAHLAYKGDRTSEAIPLFLRALEIYKPLTSKDALTDQANIYIMLGLIFRRHQSIEEALNFYEQGVDFALSARNNHALRSLLYNQSIAYRRKGDLVSAINVLTQSMDLIPDNDKIITQRTYNQFGLIYRELGEYKEAREWYNKMIQLDSLNPSPQYYRGQAYHNIAVTYVEQKNHMQAWGYFELAVQEKELLGNADKLFITYHDMAELALIQGENNLASKFAQKALELIHEVPKTPDYYKIYKLLAQCEAAQNPSQAMIYASQFMEASEAFNNQQKELLNNGDKYKVLLIASNYFNKVKREKERLKMAWTASCAAAFIFLAFVLSMKLYRIYRFRSPDLAISLIKNPNEMHYLLDLFRKEKEEMRNTLRQRK